MTPSQARCPYCDDTSEHRRVIAKEMMLGLRESFSYLECAACSSLWIEKVPADLHRYYEQYYSFAPHRRTGLRDRLLTMRNGLELGRGGTIGRWIAKLRPHPVMHAIGTLRLPRHARIVDVGCGSGWLLDELHAAGWTNVLGVDPFTAEGTRTPRGVEIQSTTFDRVDGPFDLVMFHHSLEHMSSPSTVLTDVARKLAPGGRCLVRIPTTSSEAYSIYGSDWVALDAPRHITIPSRQGIRIAAQRASFIVHSIIDDSTEFPFIGSERYRKNISFVAPSPTLPVNRDEKKALRARVARVNRQGQGDAIAVTMGLASSN